MKNLFIVACCFFAGNSLYSQTKTTSAFEPTYWGVVLEHPNMDKVKVKNDIVYTENEKKKLHIDIYSLGDNSLTRKPAIIFLNAIGETDGQPKVKSWAIYRTWPRLMAAYGYIGISMETDGNRVQECFDELFHFISKEGGKYGIDENRIGVYAASANTTQSGNYLMKENIHPGIKAAVLYYGNMPSVPLRKNLPVLFVVAEGDVSATNYQHIWGEVLKNKAPWTIKMASALPHGFDAFSDNDEARIVVKETISFWKNHLDPVVKPSWKKSVEREIVETQYWQNYPRLLEMMRQWKQNRAGTSDPAAERLYANALMNTGNFAEAETIFKRWIENDLSGNTFLLRDMVIIYYGLGKKQEAEYYLDRLMRTSSQQRNQLLGIAGRLYQLRLYASAAEFYDKANRIEGTGRDYYNAACCFALANNKEKSFENLVMAIEYGFVSKQQYESDADLELLRSDGRWNEILKKLK